MNFVRIFFFQKQLTNIPRSFTLRQYSPSSTFFLLSGLEFRTISKSYLARIFSIFSRGTPFSTLSLLHRALIMCIPVSGDIISLACSPKRKNAFCFETWGWLAELKDGFRIFISLISGDALIFSFGEREFIYINLAEIFREKLKGNMFFPTYNW